MAGSLVQARAKWFFDRKRVIRAMDAKTRRVLARTGGFSRKFMKQNMRKTPAHVISSPGRFPNSHAGQLRDLIYFEYEPKKKTVVIGPELWSGSRDTGIRSERTVPAQVNAGGRVIRLVTQNRRRVRVVQNYRPRPFVALTQVVAAKVLADNMQRESLR